MERADRKKVFFKHEGELAESLAIAQLRCLNTLRGRSRNDSDEAADELQSKLGKIELGVVTEYVATRAPISINLSPSVVDLVMADTHYRSSFETATHNAHTAGTYMTSREKWESACFLRLYDGTTAFERPKYGALNLLNAATGAAPSYGSCWLELRDHVRARCTIAPGDTSSTTCLGVLDYCNHVLKHISQRELAAIAAIAGGANPGKCTQSCYREIQIHGSLDIARDVLAIHVPAVETARGEAFERKFGVRVIVF